MSEMNTPTGERAVADLVIAGATEVLTCVPRPGDPAGRLAGVSIAVEHHGELLIAEGFGFADLEHDVPVHPDTVFRIGSVT